MNNPTADDKFYSGCLAIRSMAHARSVQRAPTALGTGRGAAIRTLPVLECQDPIVAVVEELQGEKPRSRYNFAF